jgi:hypothetical protein
MTASNRMGNGGDVDSWLGQLSLGAAAVVLFVFVGRTFVTYVGKRVTEDRDQHAKEVDRLTKSWEARLTDQKEVSKSWEDSAKSLVKTAAEQSDQLDKLLPAVDTIVKTIEAIRTELDRR